MLFDMFIDIIKKDVSISCTTAHDTARHTDYLHIVHKHNRKKHHDSPGRVTITLLNTATLWP